jgi:hypothetical protein
MSSGQNAPTAFQPPNQAGAAASFQQGANQLASTGSQLSSSVDPQLSQISQNVQNNPFQAQALAGAQAAAGTATSTVAPQQLAGASQDAQLASLAASQAPGAFNTATQAGQNAYNQTQSLLPAATAGLSAAPGVFNQAQAMIPGTTQPLINGANQVLQTGFDPQSALYNQQFQQQQDQQNAAAAMNGVAGSPYAAGLSNQANQNFNTNWQNQQLGRQTQALGAAGTADATAAGNLEGLQTSGTNNFNALTSGAVNNANSLISTGTGALNAGINTGVGAETALGNEAMAGNAGASQLGTDALNTMAGAAQLPSDVYMQQQQADLAAIGAQIQGTNSAGALTQQATADQGQYLGIGQTASQNADNAAQINNAQANAQAAGFGNLFGSVTSMFSFAPIPL